MLCEKLIVGNKECEAEVASDSRTVIWKAVNCLKRKGFVIPLSWIIMHLTHSSLPENAALDTINRKKEMVTITCLTGMQRRHSAKVQSLPNSSPSSTVCGKRWCRVSGRRRPDKPPTTDTTPRITNGNTKTSVPYNILKLHSLQAWKDVLKQSTRSSKCVLLDVHLLQIQI